MSEKAKGRVPQGEALQALQDRIWDWQQRTFPNQTLDAKLAHLVQEVNEELRKNPEDMEEWADAMILFLGAAAQAGLDLVELASAASVKQFMNEQRKWGPANAEGYHHHVEGA